MEILGGAGRPTLLAKLSSPEALRTRAMPDILHYHKTTKGTKRPAIHRLQTHALPLQLLHFGVLDTKMLTMLFIYNVQTSVWNSDQKF